MKVKGLFGFAVSITHNSKMVGPMTEKSVWIFITLLPVFISITQFPDFWVISYGNWKHILGIFSFHNFVFNDISVIKTTYWSQSEVSRKLFYFLFFSLGSMILIFFFFFFFFFLSHWWVSEFKIITFIKKKKRLFLQTQIWIKDPEGFQILESQEIRNLCVPSQIIFTFSSLTIHNPSKKNTETKREKRQRKIDKKFLSVKMCIE